MATPPPNEAVKLAILRQQLMDKIKQDQQYKQQTDRQYTVDIQPNPNWTPKKAKGGLMTDQDYLESLLDERPAPTLLDRAKQIGASAVPFVNRGIENIFPMRKIGRVGIEALASREPELVRQSPHLYGELGNAMRDDTREVRDLFRNQVRKKFGAEPFPIPERSADLGQINKGEFGKAKGGEISTDAMRLELANKGKPKAKKVEVRPTVFDDAASRRNPKIEAAAQALAEGKMKQAAYAKLVAKEKPVKAYDFIPKPATDEQAMDVLLDRQKQNWRSHENWPAGHRVGLRLDIPAYERHGVWVNSVHDESGGQDKFPTSYGPVSSVRNAEFQGNPHKGIKVATGEQSKAPFAKIMGNLEHIDEDQAVKHMQKYLNHPDYRQVGYDPRRHGDFYDRETMQPITHSEHVVQIGPLVLAKKPKYGKRTMYKQGGKVTHAHHLEIEERPL